MHQSYHFLHTTSYSDLKENSELKTKITILEIEKKDIENDSTCKLLSTIEDLTNRLKDSEEKEKKLEIKIKQIEQEKNNLLKNSN